LAAAQQLPELPLSEVGVRDGDYINASKIFERLVKSSRDRYPQVEINMKSQTTALQLVLTLTPVWAGLRFPCSTLTIQRLDPVVQPGKVPSSHVHHIVGGNAFNATMTGDVGERATCTTCQMSEDFSNYWTAHLYFRNPANGSYHRVEPKPVFPLLGGSQGAKGGLTGTC
jgi:Domain of unknown function (DUF1996)